VPTIRYEEAAAFPVVAERQDAHLVAPRVGHEKMSLIACQDDRPL
jgi:hypothetical protein